MKIIVFLPFFQGEMTLGTMTGESSKLTFVCKPCASNITVVYKPMQAFIKTIETEAGLAPRFVLLLFVMKLWVGGYIFL